MKTIKAELQKSDLAQAKDELTSLQWYVSDLEDLVRALTRELHNERSNKAFTARELRTQYRVDGFVKALACFGFTRSQAAELVKQHRAWFRLEDDHDLALSLRRLTDVQYWDNDSREQWERQRDYEARALTRVDDVLISEQGAP